MGQLGDISPAGSVAIGIIVCLLSSGVQSLGLTLQRKSHLLEDEKEEPHARRPPYRRRRWQLGFGMFLAANLIGSTIQITTLPLPVLSALQASGLVFNSMLATLILAEPFTRYSFAGTTLVTLGALLIALYGALPEPAHSLDELLALLEREPFILWMIGQGILVAAVLAGAYALKLLHPLGRNSARVRLLRGMAFACISGILSAHSLLLAKSAVELLVRTIVDGNNQFVRWQSWAIVLGLIGLALAQLYVLHQGLKLVSTSVLYPFVFCVYNIVAIMDGLIYFDQFSQISNLAAGLIALGTVILLSGVVCLSWRLSSEDIQTHPSRPGTPMSPTTVIAENPLLPNFSLAQNPPTESDPLLSSHRPSTYDAMDEDQKDDIDDRTHVNTLFDPLQSRPSKTSTAAGLSASRSDLENGLTIRATSTFGPRSPTLPTRRRLDDKNVSDPLPSLPIPKARKHLTFATFGTLVPLSSSYGRPHSGSKSITFPVVFSPPRRAATTLSAGYGGLRRLEERRRLAEREREKQKREDEATRGLWGELEETEEMEGAAPSRLGLRRASSGSSTSVSASAGLKGFARKSEGGGSASEQSPLLRRSSGQSQDDRIDGDEADDEVIESGTASLIRRDQRRRQSAPGLVSRPFERASAATGGANDERRSALGAGGAGQRQDQGWWKASRLRDWLGGQNR